MYEDSDVIIDFYDDEGMDENPNLYISLTESDHSGYLLTESGGPIFLESGDYLFT